MQMITSWGTERKYTDVINSPKFATSGRMRTAFRQTTIQYIASETRICTLIGLRKILQKQTIWTSRFRDSIDFWKDLHTATAEDFPWQIL